MSSLAIGNNNNNAINIRELRVPSPGSDDQPKSCGQKIKDCFKAAIGHFVHAIRHAAEFLAHAVYSHNNIQALAKFGKSTISFVKYAFKAQSEGFNNLYDQFYTLDDAINVANFIVDVKEWIVPSPDRDDDNKEKFLWNHKYVTKWKIISKAVGTASNAIGAFNFFVNVGLLKLARFSAYLNTIPFFRVILKFSPLRVVKDSLTVISSSLVIVDHSIGIHRKRTWTQGNKGKKKQLKLEKWEVKNSLRKYLSGSAEDKQAILNKNIKGQNGVGTIEEFEPQYLNQLRNSYLNVRKTLMELGAKPKRENPLVPEEKWDDIKARYEDRQLREINITKCSEKISKKGKKLAANGKIGQTKDWLAIAFNVAKIAAIIIGLVGVFALAVSTNVAFLVIMATAWFITSALGMARVYYGFRHQKVL